ncbi:alpha/beta hydrolase fold domain-containing protein [Pararhodobacter zhoushanensis]|uniref:Alpha/beta hydrolase fold domain-containing protein n=1 Tax=Pararhodobacter zhoushanensis TaxID=2479545 RepID=A0ABT3GTR7_9RHOB|nr:alpha/beta hydrolase fold domain-containing protein [Pararhodobacter zhoushanensis]MCW1930923.1 alpha/beta hydrolase fold domain-containing protein [Pararhodobacter zhoushanensis]
MGEGVMDGGQGRQRWKQNPEGVRRAILDAAQAEFARHGYASTRVEDIAAQTATSKRMIYYYFTDKEGLYLQALESAYAQVRQGEAALRLDHLPPVQALRTLVEFTFDHHRAHPDFIRLVMIENVHNADNLRASGLIGRVNKGAIEKLADLLARGQAQGLFRPDILPLELHWHISALSFFNVSNRPSFTESFGGSLFAEAGQARLKAQAVEAVLRLVQAGADTLTPTPETPMLNPELTGFLTAWTEKWAALPPGASPADRRKRFEVIAAEMRLPTPEDVDCETEHWIDSKAGPVRVRVFRHRAGGTQPCLIYMHGGAWMQGSPETHWDITSRIASANRQTVISVDYALAPEHPFPAALDQCVAVARWAHATAGSLGIDPARIAVGGDSAGGNLAAALALDLRGSEVPLIAQLLIYPACDFDKSRPSYSENAEAPLLQVKGMDMVNAMYSPDTAQLHTNPRVAPLVAASHADLPPAFIAVAQNDPLRDSGLAYADALRSAGVPVTQDNGSGLIHGYLRAMEYCAASRTALAAMTDWLAQQQTV